MSSAADLLSTTTNTDNVSSPRERLAAIRELRAIIDQEEAGIVATMRAAGHSWTDVAELAGLQSRQRAQQKFGQRRLFNPTRA